MVGGGCQQCDIIPAAVICTRAAFCSYDQTVSCLFASYYRSEYNVCVFLFVFCFLIIHSVGVSEQLLVRLTK